MGRYAAAYWIKYTYPFARGVGVLGGQAKLKVNMKKLRS
jgi:hypothetical protein